MKIIPTLIDEIAHGNGVGVPYAALKNLMLDAERTDLTGPEKRDKVLADFRAIGYDLAEWVVELIWGLAIAWVKGQVSHAG